MCSEIDRDVDYHMFAAKIVFGEVFGEKVLLDQNGLAVSYGEPDVLMVELLSPCLHVSCYFVAIWCGRVSPGQMLWMPDGFSVCFGI